MLPANDSRKRAGRHGLFIVGGVALAAVVATFVGRYALVHKPSDLRQSVDSGKAGSAQEAVGPAQEEAAVVRGKDLYTNYCAQCHGDKGEGNGPAAIFLYPKPRNFTKNEFRIVSTTNGLPSDLDLMHVVTYGMPGSAMFPFGHLSESEREDLVSYVRGLIRIPYEDQYRHNAAENNETVIPQEMAEALDRVLRPGPELEIPPNLAPENTAALARGQALYQATCAPCHGPTGKGDGAQEQRNNDGTPTRPRDFTRGIFKGGRAFGDLYRRVMLGMPGSPMPSSTTALKPEQVSDVVSFVLTLSSPAAQSKVEHKRSRLLAKKASGVLDHNIADSQWAVSTPVAIVVSPLWWREYPEPDLRVQALHDGHTLAIRMSWHDDTRNDQAVRIQDFEDMAAVQLFRGAREPFLGMGMADKSVDVWLWRASWQGNSASYADVDTAYPNMGIDLYPFEQAGGGPRTHAPDRQPAGFLTARAAGNLRSDPSAVFTANSLEAKGFGTLTMRPRLSQLVSAQATWKDRRWTVLLRRPLEVKSPDSGLSLAPGENLAIAFALWDGAAKDRNGQKLVSIWHDLQLE
jgi:mono/diheme cytochrome c family protein